MEKTKRIATEIVAFNRAFSHNTALCIAYIEEQLKQFNGGSITQPPLKIKKRKYQAWTPEEDKQLMILNRKYSYPDGTMKRGRCATIGRKLGRTTASVYTRSALLKKRGLIPDYNKKQTE